MNQAIGSVAAGFGYAIRFLILALQVAIGAAGPLFVCYGVWLIYPPAAFIAIGLVLMVIAPLALGKGRSK